MLMFIYKREEVLTLLAILLSLVISDAEVVTDRQLRGFSTL